MKKFLADLIGRLTSRKFLITLGTALILVANQQWNELVLLVSAYLASEGAGDVVERFQTQKTKQAEANLEDTKVQFGVIDGNATAVDRSEIVSGNDIPMQ